MPLPREQHTSADYWSLPDGQRAELIEGQLYDMAPPSRIHQRISAEIARILGNYIADHNGTCQVYPAPFAVNLDADDRNWVEPDISVICDRNKLTDRGCAGAPDLIVEIVSPSSRKLDYIIKANLYLSAGIREYWIVDPARKTSMVYCFASGDSTPTMYPFEDELPCFIFEGLQIRISDLI